MIQMKSNTKKKSSEKLEYWQKKFLFYVLARSKNYPSDFGMTYLMLFFSLEAEAVKC